MTAAVPGWWREPLELRAEHCNRLVQLVKLQAKKEEINMLRRKGGQAGTSKYYTPWATRGHAPIY